jgi:hypothetical protein
MQIRIVGPVCLAYNASHDVDVQAVSRAITWNKMTSGGESVPSGVYLVRGSLETEARKVSETRGRIIVIK